MLNVQSEKSQLQPDLAVLVEWADDWKKILVLIYHWPFPAWDGLSDKLSPGTSSYHDFPMDSPITNKAQEHLSSTICLILHNVYPRPIDTRKHTRHHTSWSWRPLWPNRNMFHVSHNSLIKRDLPTKLADNYDWKSRWWTIFSRKLHIGLNSEAAFLFVD